MLAPEPDLEAVGFAGDEDELWPLLERTRPFVLVLDLHHPGRDGLALCLQVKRRPAAPRVVMYSASATADVLVPALIAGADAVVSKASSGAELLTAIRAVARGDHVSPSPPARAQAAAAARLAPADHAILAMRLAGHPPADIGETLGLPARKLADRTAAIVRTLVR
jgi:DNA-binding NarL/FixJ family response regulator